MSLLITGTVAFDAIETPFGKTDKILGGAGTFIALASSFFQQKEYIQIVSVVGNDFPEEYLEMLRSKGVSTEGIQVKTDEKTFFWSGKYHNDMNSRDTLVTELNVLATFDPLVPEGFNAPDYLMLGNLSPQVQLSLLNRLVKRPKLVVMDTMNFWMDIALDDLKATLKLVDVLCINDSEARQLSGDYSLKKAAKTIQGMGPHTLIIKKGEHGALLFHGEEMFYCPALPLEEVFDPTGAGDTFAGGFIGYLASTDDISFENMKRGIIYGSALASFCVKEFGTAALQKLSKAEVEACAQEFKKLSSFNL